MNSELRLARSRQITDHYYEETYERNTEMDFNKQKPIYMQIADTLCERIVAGEWGVDERIPSARDVAAKLGVNPNTVMRTFDYLQNAEIIYNRRGVGYFVDSKAKNNIVAMNRQYFINEELPYLLQRMNMLGITLDEIAQMSNNK